MCGMTNTTGSGEDEGKGNLGDAFVAGAKWWEFCRTGSTMWGDDQAMAGREAKARGYDFRQFEERVLEGKLSAALRREEVLREALNLALDSYQKTLDGLAAEYNFQSADVRTEHDYALSACDEGRK